MSAPGASARRLNVAALGAGWAVFVAANAQRIDVVPFFTDLRSYFHVDYTGVGALLSAYLLGYVLAQVPMGLAADNLPTRRVTVTGLALLAVTSGLFALTRQYWVAMLLRFLMGVSGAALYSSTVKQLLGIAPSRGTAMGVLQSGAGMGMVVGLFGLPLLAQVAGLWPAFLALTAGTAATCVYAAVCLPAVATRAVATESAAQQVGGVLRDRYFLLISSSNALALFGVYGITAWIPTYLQNEFHFGSAAAGAVAASINVGLAVASPATGVISDRLGVRSPVVFTGISTLVASFVLLILVHRALAVVVSAVVAGVGIALTLPIMTTMTTEVFGVERSGVAISMNLAVAQVASTISGVLFGFLLDATGSFRLLWTVGALVCALGLVPAGLLCARERAGVRADVARGGAGPSP